jgi:dihydrolipoamide dehydrogenase
VIERDLTGGTCLNRGCIPTKTMLYSASIVSKIREASLYGVEAGDPRVDFPKVVKRSDDVVLRLRTGIETLFRANKIELVRGSARLKDRNTIEVSGSDDISARFIMVAAGSKPMAIPEAPLDGSLVLSSDGILRLKELPKELLVIGGGIIGCEFASLFNAFGVKVTIAEFCDRLIPSASREVSRKMEQIFRKRGMEILTGTSLASVKTGAGIEAFLKNGKSVRSDLMLVSVGRSSVLDGLGLTEAGIETKDGKVAVDEYLRTSVKNIYAAGDCVGGPLLAQKASYDGMLACDNMLGKNRKTDYYSIPNCMYTDPEVAGVGLNEDAARLTHPEIKVAKFPYIASGKAFLMGKSEGFIKIIGDPLGNLVGAEIMGEGASDLIGELTMAKTLGVNIKDVARVVHGHPTLSEVIQEAAHIFCGTPIHSL